MKKSILKMKKIFGNFLIISILISCGNKNNKQENSVTTQNQSAVKNKEFATLSSKKRSGLLIPAIQKLSIALAEFRNSKEYKCEKGSITVSASPEYIPINPNDYDCIELNWYDSIFSSPAKEITVNFNQCEYTTEEDQLVWPNEVYEKTPFERVSGTLVIKNLTNSRLWSCTRHGEASPDFLLNAKTITGSLNIESRHILNNKDTDDLYNFDGDIYPYKEGKGFRRIMQCDINLKNINFEKWPGDDVIWSEVTWSGTICNKNVIKDSIYGGF